MKSYFMQYYQLDNSHKLFIYLQILDNDILKHSIIQKINNMIYTKKLT